MPDPSASKGDPPGFRPRNSSLWSEDSWRAEPKRGSVSAAPRLIIPLLATLFFWPILIALQSSQARAANGNPFDIGIVIDNRPLPRNDAARADVDLLVEMLDRQIFIEHIIVFERPTVQVICGLFGCPGAIDATAAFPPLIWQITREDEARLFVYYIGDGRAEGLERQLLFKRRERGSEDDVVGLSVTWLHRQLEAASPKSAVLMLDTDFAPTRIPCADDDPARIVDALSHARRNYRRIAEDERIPSDHVELSVTTPVHAPDCGRFERMLDQTERSPFTQHVIEGLIDGRADQEPFGDEDRLIDLGELAGYMNERIERAARFQWGRAQNVRAVGPRSRALATVDGRAMGERTQAILERRNRPPEPTLGQEIIGATDADGGDDDPAQRPAPEDRASRCRADPAAKDCHPCVMDPGSRACAERCQQDDGSDLCARHLTASTEPIAKPADPAPDLAGAITVTRIEEERPAEAVTERSATCRWTADRIAPYASALMRGIDGDTEPSCSWATDRSEVERGPLARVFTPIGWRLGRSTVQDAVMCLLNCDPDTPAERGEAPIDPRSLGAFNREVCDRLHEPVPPYIGLPRWMPGTLMISEALQAGYGCPPPPAEPVMPVPIAVAIEAPPEVVDPEESDVPEEEGEPTPGRSSDVIIADDRLDQWPPHAAGIDLPPGDTEATDAGDLAADAGITETTPSGLDSQQDEPSAPIEEPFAETAGKVRWLQRALTVDNRAPGPIDGVIGRQTMEAVASWRRDNGRADRTGALTEEEFLQILEQFARRFGQIEPSD